jgi:hypothetical protein
MPTYSTQGKARVERSGPDRDRPVKHLRMAKVENPAGCQPDSGRGLLAGVERTVRAATEGRDGHARADPTNRFGESSEP